MDEPWATSSGVGDGEGIPVRHLPSVGTRRFSRGGHQGGLAAPLWPRMAMLRIRSVGEILSWPYNPPRRVITESLARPGLEPGSGAANGIPSRTGRHNCRLPGVMIGHPDCRPGVTGASTGGTGTERGSRQKPEGCGRRSGYGVSWPGGASRLVPREPPLLEERETPVAEICPVHPVHHVQSASSCSCQGRP